MIGVPPIADMVERADLSPVAGHDAVAGGSREQAPELRLPPRALLDALVVARPLHGNPLRSEYVVLQRIHSGRRFIDRTYEGQ